MILDSLRTTGLVVNLLPIGCLVPACKKPCLCTLPSSTKPSSWAYLGDSEREPPWVWRLRSYSLHQAGSHRQASPLGISTRLHILASSSLHPGLFLPFITSHGSRLLSASVRVETALSARRPHRNAASRGRPQVLASRPSSLLNNPGLWP